MTYPIQPGPLSLAEKFGKLPNTLSLAEPRRPVQTSHWLFFNCSTSMDTWGNLSNLWIPCVYHLDQESQLNMNSIRHHRSNFMSPPKLAMSMRCLISLSAPSSHSTSGPLEWRQRTPLSQIHQTHKTHGDSKSLFPPTANKTFAKLRRTQPLARPKIRAAFSTFS